jgi:hypothetical protein
MGGGNVSTFSFLFLFWIYEFFFVIWIKVLNSGRGRMKDFAISVVTAVVLRITVVAVW